MQLQPAWPFKELTANNFDLGDIDRTFMTKGVLVTSKPEKKPAFRGVMHKYAFFASIPAALFLIYQSPNLKVFWPILIYSLSLMALLGTSALYHRINWTDKYRDTMGTLDRTMIYFFIAGSFTPFAVLSMEGTVPFVVLSILWSSVIFGAVINFFWYSAPTWIHALLYLLVSWLCIFALPQLWENLGSDGLFWVFFGGILYSVGAIVYATKFPNPWPKTFGFHEVFHCFVTVGVAIHYAVIAAYLIPSA
ncbi:MAG: hemolysin III family protein [Myxococcota bacterium]|nr:hemolysin III family protein [Myxococcota bacterium]